MEKEGLVSLWIGNFKSINELEKYVKINYNEDGDLIDSKFETDFLIKYYDEDFREIDCTNNKTDNLCKLLEGFSYDNIVIKNFVKKFRDKLNKEVNSIILLYNFEYNGDIDKIETGGNTLKYIATVSYRKEDYMEIKAICQSDKLWQKTIEYALRCPWKAGPFLGRAMKDNQFSDWERVFVVLKQENVIGFCTLAKTDCIPNISYYPYIGYVFVDEKYRGNRVSEKMIKHVLSYAKKLGFKKVYLVSDQINLYEKYGFVKINQKKDLWGNNEKIYMHLT